MPVSSGDPRPVPFALEDPRLGDRHLAREVAADHARLGGDPLARLGLGHLAGEDAAAHRARLADVADERAGVDAVDARDPVVAQPVEPALVGAGRVRLVDGGAHDRRAGVDAVGLHARLAHPVVADVRVGEGDELPGEARVAHRLLVAGHAGREDDLAGHRAGRADGIAVEARAVFEQDVRRHPISRHARLLPW